METRMRNHAQPSQTVAYAAVAQSMRGVGGIFCVIDYG